MYPKQVIRYISGHYSTADEEFVRQWMSEDPSRQESLKKLREVWALTEKLDVGDVDHAWVGLLERITKNHNALPHTSRLRSKKAPQIKSGGLLIFLRVAAVLVLGVGAYAFFFQHSRQVELPQSNVEEVFHTISSKKGEQVHFRFNEGTKVVLNASSHIRYRSDFGKIAREIYLDGEAYFEVNHDHPHPFIVHANGARIEDIATKFNITAYPKRDKVEVVVSEGKVKVSPQENIKTKKKRRNKDNVSSVVVSQGQKVQVGGNQHSLKVQKADLHQALSWLQKRLVFDAEPLAQVAKRLERYYDIRVEVADTSLYDKKLTASFEDERIENVLKVLAISINANYSLKDHKAIFFIKERPSNLNQ